MKTSQYLREARTIFTNGLLLKNPLLIGALGLYPVIAGAYSLKNALTLSLLILVISLPVGLIMCFFGELVPLWLRPGVALGLNALVYIPAAALAEQIMPGVASSLGMISGLMICNSMVLSRLNDYAPSHIGLAVAADALGCTLGYSLILLAVAAFREFLLTGQVTGGNVTGGKSFALPFFGLICVGFLAAFVQWINEHRIHSAAKRGADKA